MIHSRALRLAIAGSTLATSLLCAVDFSTYRGFRFGDSVDATAKQAGMKPSEAKLIHERPAMIQELEWRPGFAYAAGSAKADPVREGLLRFYNGELFQIVTTYDHQRVAGLTAADMAKVISTTYGPSTKPRVEIPFHSNYGETAAVIARWGNSEYSYSLVRTGDQASFALILSLNRLDALAQKAIVEATRLDELDAPKRAAQLQKRQDAEMRLVLDKARLSNMPNFRP